MKTSYSRIIETCGHLSEIMESMMISLAVEDCIAGKILDWKSDCRYSRHLPIELPFDLKEHAAREDNIAPNFRFKKDEATGLYVRIKPFIQELPEEEATANPDFFNVFSIQLSIVLKGGCEKHTVKYDKKPDGKGDVYRMELEFDHSSYDCWISKFL